MLVRPYYDTVEVENGVFLSRSHEKWSLEVMESHGKVMEKCGNPGFILQVFKQI